jgi:lysozyme
MARTRKRNTSARGSSRRWLLRGAALAALLGITFAAWLWWDMRSWRPDEALYPEQGALIASGGGAVRFETIAALGGAFVYLALPETGGAPDPGFSARLAAARAAGLKVGVVQRFNPCLRADPQSADFTRQIARDGALLPPAIALERLADGCDPQVSDAAVESELMTLINQIERHAGKPVILKLGRAFEDRHRTATTLARDLWLARDRARPDYAGRPWLLWSANSALVTEASEDPIEWVVVQK